MKMIDELKPLTLYSSNKKIYIPIDEKDKRRNSAILLLTTSIDNSIKLMNMPYIYNPNLFKSFYINRNVQSYISSNAIDFDKDIESVDEVEDKNISEGFLFSKNKIKFVFDDDVSLLSKRYINECYNNDNVKRLCKIIGFGVIPKDITINIKIYSTFKKLKDHIPSIFNNYFDNIYSYSSSNEIGVLNKLYFDPNIAGGDYNSYLNNELLYSIIMNYNPSLNPIIVRGISCAASRQYEWINKNKDLFTGNSNDKYIKVAKICNNIIKSNDNNIILRYIKYGDLEGFLKYQRNNVIINIMKTFGLSESAIIDNDIDNFDDVEKICSTLSKEELSKITFTDSYENSKFVIKRIIHKIDDEPVGFLDVYQFPTKPEIAQIVIAVNSKFRGMGIANSMVSELMKSDLQNKYNFNIYYWTAHPENIPSQRTALGHGFIDYNIIDRYGRKVFIKIVKDFKDDIPPYLPKPIYSKYIKYKSSDDDFKYSEMSINEANFSNEYNKKLKSYLYSERIKNRHEIISLYDYVKSRNPWITKTYPNIKLYKKNNIFVDLSYYHSLFLNKNNYKNNRAVYFYFDFVNRLINDEEINSEYTKRTIFIPIDENMWNIKNNSDITDYTVNINPFSVLLRLIRINLPTLKKEWGNKNIIFIGSKGYFTIDFSKVDVRDIPKIKSNISKLTSSGSVIVDEDEETDRDKDSSKVIATKIIDKIENDADIKINNISGINVLNKDNSNIMDTSDHLRINNNYYSKLTSNTGTAIVTIDPGIIINNLNNSTVKKIKIKKYYSI